MKIASRTIHVQVTVSVEVPFDNAKTTKQALDFAKQNWQQLGNEFECLASVFETNTVAESIASETKAWRLANVK